MVVCNQEILVIWLFFWGDRGHPLPATYKEARYTYGTVEHLPISKKSMDLTIYFKVHFSMSPLLFGRL